MCIFLTTNFEFKFFHVCPYPDKKSLPSFVNMSPTLVIDTSMEKSLRVLQQGIQKNRISFHKIKLAEAQKKFVHETALFRDYV